MVCLLLGVFLRKWCGLAVATATFSFLKLLRLYALLRTVAFSRLAGGQLGGGPILPRTLILISQLEIIFNMNTQYNSQTENTDAEIRASNTGTLNSLDLLSEPVGTFAGTQDRMIRIRNGQRIPADTGDQGGGQN